MARTVKQIYDALIAEKNNQATLNGLQPSVDSAQALLTDVASTSKVADWRLWLWVVATGIYILETLFDSHKAEVEAIAAAAIPGTARWYRDQALKFQFGYQLVYLNDKFQYSAIDTNAQIIKRAAVVESAGQVIIKVAKLVGSTVTPLSSQELAAFDSYINLIRYAGTNTLTVSKNPDLLKVAYTVYYDPQVLAPNGSLLSNPAVFTVHDAINNHLSNLPFNGELVLTTLTDEVQKAQGVKNPVLTLAQAKYGALPYSTINVKYIPDAGHMIVDSAFPLTTQITYIAA